VSIALLGFGASGTALTIFLRWTKGSGRSLGLLGIATGFSILGAYLLTDTLPFDSFSIAWTEAGWILVLHYIGPGNTLLLQWHGGRPAAEMSTQLRRGHTLKFAWLAPGVHVGTASASISGAEGTYAKQRFCCRCIISLKNGSPYTGICDKHRRSLEASAFLLLIFVCLTGSALYRAAWLPLMDLICHPIRGFLCHAIPGRR